MTSPMDTLTSSDVQDLLRDKYVLILGDSIVRGLYKDLVNFFHHDNRSNEEELYVQGEKRFHGDQLLYTRPKKAKTNAPDYEEAREFTGGGRVRIRFYFLSRCFPKYMKYAIFQEIKNQIIKPDIVIMNSCLRDITEDNPNVMKYYYSNLQQMLSEFRQILPSETLFLWLSTLPVSNASQGCIIDPDAEYLKLILPGLIRDANAHCAQLCDEHQILYVDLHTTFSHLLHLRLQDGVRWDAVGIRIMNEMILHHIQAYYSGIQKFKCIFLREQLSKKLIKYQQRTQGPLHQVDRSETTVSNDLLSVERRESDVKSILTIKNESMRNRNQEKRPRENDASRTENQLAKKAKVNKKPTIPNSKDSSVYNTKSNLINLKKQNVSKTILIPIHLLPENATLKQEKFSTSGTNVLPKLNTVSVSQISTMISVKQENEAPLHSNTASKFPANYFHPIPEQSTILQERNVSALKAVQPKVNKISINPTPNAILVKQEKDTSSQLNIQSQLPSNNPRQGLKQPIIKQERNQSVTNIVQTKTNTHSINAVSGKIVVKQEKEILPMSNTQPQPSLNISHLVAGQLAMVHRRNLPVSKTTEPNQNTASSNLTSNTITVKQEKDISSHLNNQSHLPVNISQSVSKQLVTRKEKSVSTVNAVQPNFNMFSVNPMSDMITVKQENDRSSDKKNQFASVSTKTPLYPLLIKPKEEFCELDYIVLSSDDDDDNNVVH